MITKYAPQTTLVQAAVAGWPLFLVLYGATTKNPASHAMWYVPLRDCMPATRGSVTTFKVPTLVVDETFRFIESWIEIKEGGGWQRVYELPLVLANNHLCAGSTLVLGHFSITST